MAIILLMISALLTSLAITREKELGTLEQLLVLPLRPREIMLGKIIPYIVLAAIDGALILLVGYCSSASGSRAASCSLRVEPRLHLHRRSPSVFSISTIARKQQQAMMIVLPATMLPTIILSGFIFPLASLPFAAALHQRRWSRRPTFSRSSAASCSRGSALPNYGGRSACSAASACCFVAVSVKKFRERL